MIGAVEFGQQESLRHRAARLGRSRESIRRRYARRLDGLLHRLPIPRMPHGPLIAVIDGWWVSCAGQPFTLYIVLLRPVAGQHATVMEPLLLPGRESEEGWAQALAALPLKAQHQIVAVVCDGAVVLWPLIRSRGWLLQRCHFHLLASIRNYISAGWRSRKRNLGKSIFNTVQTTLRTNAPDELVVLRLRLLRLIRQVKNWKLRSRLNGFLRNLEDHHTYLRHPELHIPTTTNAAECVCGLVSDTIHRTRGFSTPESLHRWITVQIRLMKPVRCNGFNYQPN